MKIFECLGLECPSDSDDSECFEKKMQALKKILSIVLHVSSEDDTKKESNTINQSTIVTSSGMCDDGMVLTLLPLFLQDPNSTVILTGYQAENTNGLLLKQIAAGMFNDNKQYMYNKHFNEIDLRLCDVKFRIVDMSQYYSGHADCEQLCNFVHGRDEHENVFETKVFLNHGTKESRINLKERIEKMNSETGHKISVELPKLGIPYEL